MFKKVQHLNCSVDHMVMGECSLVKFETQTIISFIRVGQRVVAVDGHHAND